MKNKAENRVSAIGSIGLGTLLCAAGFYLNGYDEKYHNFEMTQGNIIGSDIVDMSSLGYGGYRGSFAPEIEYSYVVDGTKHVYRNVFYQHQFSYRKEAEDFLADHKPGKKVSVYYRVDDPSKGVLETNVTDSYAGYILIGCGLFLFLQVFVKNGRGLKVKSLQLS
jgi:hypothetical protein